MNPPNTQILTPSTFWSRWLIVATTAMLVLSLAMVVIPQPVQRLFVSLCYPAPESMDTLDASARAYILLFQGVLGGVMFGWAAALLLILLGPFRRGHREGWTIMTVSLIAWFIPDTAFSLLTGFWLNAALNVAFLLVFTIPLAATASTFFKGKQFVGGQYEQA